MVKSVIMTNMQATLHPAHTTLAERLLIARRRAGVDAGTIATRCGVTRKTISSWEGGHSEPTVSHLHGLANALGVPADNWDAASDRVEAGSIASRRAVAYMGVAVDRGQALDCPGF